MRIVNPNDEKNPFYAGQCKGNMAPKHVTDGAQKKVKLDKKPVTMFDSPKSKDYIYFKIGDNWMFVKDKGIFALDTLVETKVSRKVEAAEATPEVVQD